MKFGSMVLFALISLIFGSSVTAFAFQPADLQGRYVLSSGEKGCPEQLQANVNLGWISLQENGKVFWGTSLSELNQGATHYEDSHFFTASTDDINLFTRDDNALIEERVNTQYSMVPFKRMTEKTRVTTEVIKKADGITFLQTEEYSKPLSKTKVNGVRCNYRFE